ncbi:HypC/HybG/HupF family hydrogenase formation chaperone [Barnesiella sp. An55]|uniref:HypC/HybG/HupF family hydrogenase formation chaperone n=1 Tax=Barnesiella sp. An55 TaxID=1965646 RepID=UPI000B36978A|nr:HypC/HybG/HupF family hydrogenase formation chaperone [Barnesiella sp. An55]OUN70858.1 hydrogenase assembly protein HypC [Barnesiella sp. An55]HIZ26540.1 HypC/HybG/HupF family hydrogenase formation chaperone [Candidatus Barnesiella merdipullorum]
MCLAIPGKIIAIDDSCTLRMATVDFGGVYRPICIQYTDASTGDYVLAHAGMAIARLDREEAEATLADFEKLAQAQPTPPDSHVV